MLTSRWAVKSITLTLSSGVGLLRTFFKKKTLVVRNRWTQKWLERGIYWSQEWWVGRRKRWAWAQAEGLLGGAGGGSQFTGEAGSDSWSCEGWQRCGKLGVEWLRSRFSGMVWSHTGAGDNNLAPRRGKVWVQVHVLVILNVLQVCRPALLQPATKPRPASPSTSETRNTKHRPHTGHHKVQIITFRLRIAACRCSKHGLYERQDWSE